MRARSKSRLPQGALASQPGHCAVSPTAAKIRARRRPPLLPLPLLPWPSAAPSAATSCSRRRPAEAAPLAQAAARHARRRTAGPTRIARGGVSCGCMQGRALGLAKMPRGRNREKEGARRCQGPFICTPDFLAVLLLENDCRGLLLPSSRVYRAAGPEVPAAAAAARDGRRRAAAGDNRLRRCNVLAWPWAIMHACN